MFISVYIIIRFRVPNLGCGRTDPENHLRGGQLNKTDPPGYPLQTGVKGNKSTGQSRGLTTRERKEGETDHPFEGISEY